MTLEPDEPRMPEAHRLGETLDDLSVDELDARIVALNHEIARLEQARERKRGAQASAHAFFKT